MPCYHPLVGYRSKDINPSGKYSIVFSISQAAEPDNPLKVPCGKCIGCRLENSRQWAIRCVFEASTHEHNSFITLTYSEENLPLGGTLVPSDHQKFIKRLRKRLPTLIRDGFIASDPGPILYKHAGEYGETNGRPHYHSILFNVDFRDKVLDGERNGQKYYVSQTLAELWPYGKHVIGDVTFESAAYVARYITKKLSGKLAELSEHYVNRETGMIRKEEYSTQSNGIAKAWLKKFVDDVYPSDFIVLRGVKMAPPKYFDRNYELWMPSHMEAIKDDRLEKSRRFRKDSTRERLEVREEIKKEQIKLLSRGYENEQT